MYYVLEDPPKGGPHVGLARDGADQDLMWIQGQPIDPDRVPGPLRIVAEDHYDEYPDFMDIGLGVAVSQAFADALREAGVDNVDLFEAGVYESGVLVAEGYHLLNLRGTIDAIDREASEVTEFRGRVARIKSLKIDESKTHGARMFRLAEYPHVLIIDQKVRDALEAADLSGFVISAADGWGDGHRL
jgi:hypothetical protein